jgi:hypothetical protein
MNGSWSQITINLLTIFFFDGNLLTIGAKANTLSMNNFITASWVAICLELNHFNTKFYYPIFLKYVFWASTIQNTIVSILIY